MGRRSCVKWCLLGCLIVGVAFLGVSVFQPGRLTNAVKLVANNAFAEEARTLTKGPVVEEYTLAEMVIESVGVGGVDLNPIVVLKERAGERYMIISIGLAEAHAIAVIIEGVEVPRPLTSDLLTSILNRLEAKVESIVIDDIKDDIFYATITLDANWTKIKIDSRPSDAMAIAVRVGAPIYVEEAVLDKVGIKPAQDAEDFILMQIVGTNKY